MLVVNLSIMLLITLTLLVTSKNLESRKQEPPTSSNDSSSLVKEAV